MEANMPKLHLGCFDQVVNGWTNTDITPHIFVARIPGLAYLFCKSGLMSRERYRQHQSGIFRNVRYLDVTRRFPFHDNTFDCIYSSHLLEHLRPSHAEFCLRESYRVLRPSGVLRLAVPDLDEMVRKYDPCQPDAFLEQLLEPHQRGSKNRHHWNYNEHSLAGRLQAVGFRDVARRGYRQGLLPDLESIEIRPESLFMEALK